MPAYNNRIKNELCNLDIGRRVAVTKPMNFLLASSIFLSFLTIRKDTLKISNRLYHNPVYYSKRSTISSMNVQKIQREIYLLSRTSQFMELLPALFSKQIRSQLSFSLPMCMCASSTEAFRKRLMYATTVLSQYTSYTRIASFLQHRRMQHFPDKPKKSETMDASSESPSTSVSSQQTPSSSTARSASSSSPKLQRGDSNGGDGHHMFPREEHKYTIIFMHGLGDTGFGWADLTYNFATYPWHKNTKYIFPTAPVNPVTLNGGFQMNAWADIYGLSADAPEDKKGYESSVARIATLVQNEIEKNKITSEHIIIGGFSQGGALAYLVGLQSPYRLGAIISLSAWIPLQMYERVSSACLGISAAKGNDNIIGTPIFHCHGDADDLVQPEYGRLSVEMLKAAYEKENAMNKRNVEFRIYKGLGHSANPEELKDVGSFISSVFKFG